MMLDKILFNCSFQVDCVKLQFQIYSLTFIKPYLPNRKLFVSVDYIFPKPGIFNRGISQGSILWPLSMIFPNHYDKVILTFVLMIHAFFVKTKTFTKLKML